MANNRLHNIIRESISRVLQEGNNSAGVDINTLKEKYYALTSAMGDFLNLLEKMDINKNKDAQRAYKAILDAYNQMQPLVSRPNGLKIWMEE